jgi:plant G-box-binding factor
MDDDWDDEFVAEIFRVADLAAASCNPNPTTTPTPTPAAISYLPAHSAPVSCLLPAASAAASSVPHLPALSAPVSCLLPAASATASSYRSPEPGFSPPRELTQRPPEASNDGEAVAVVGRGFSPPPELSQRPAPEESDLAIVAESATAGGGGRVGAKRERETRELEKLKVFPLAVFWEPFMRMHLCSVL